MNLHTTVKELIFILRCLLPTLISKYQTKFPKAIFEFESENGIEYKITVDKKTGDGTFLLTVKNLMEPEK